MSSRKSRPAAQAKLTSIRIIRAAFWTKHLDSSSIVFVFRAGGFPRFLRISALLLPMLCGLIEVSCRPDQVFRPGSLPDLFLDGGPPVDNCDHTDQCGDRHDDRGDAALDDSAEASLRLIAA